jgi:hypothetical protein
MKAAKKEGQKAKETAKDISTATTTTATTTATTTITTTAGSKDIVVSWNKFVRNKNNGQLDLKENKRNENKTMKKIISKKFEGKNLVKRIMLRLVANSVLCMYSLRRVVFFKK